MRRGAAARARGMLVVLAGLGVAACGEPADGGARAGAAAGSAPAAQAASGSGRGELLALACRACHTLEPGEPHAIGPNLFGVFGRRAGSLADFEYSEALAESDIVWTAEQLEAWLAEPNDFMPGTTMTFTGYASAADRRALVAYLRDVTTPPKTD